MSSAWERRPGEPHVKYILELPFSMFLYGICHQWSVVTVWGADGPGSVHAQEGDTPGR